MPASKSPGLANVRHRSDSLCSTNLDGSGKKTFVFGQGNLTGVAYA
jgi:hypothetical protein